MELHNRDNDHLCSSTTATIALQLELKVVVVVGANIVMQLIQSISMHTHPKFSWNWKKSMVYFPVNGITLSKRESYVPSGVKLPP